MFENTDRPHPNRLWLELVKVLIVVMLNICALAAAGHFH